MEFLATGYADDCRTHPELELDSPLETDDKWCWSWRMIEVHSDSVTWKWKVPCKGKSSSKWPFSTSMLEGVAPRKTTKSKNKNLAMVVLFERRFIRTFPQLGSEYSLKSQVLKGSIAVQLRIPRKRATCLCQLPVHGASGPSRRRSTC